MTDKEKLDLLRVNELLFNISSLISEINMLKAEIMNNRKLIDVLEAKNKELEKKDS